MQSIEDIRARIAPHEARLNSGKAVASDAMPETVLAQAAVNEIENSKRAWDDLHTKRRRLERSL